MLQHLKKIIYSRKTDFLIDSCLDFGAVLMFHRIVPPKREGIYLNQILNVSPVFFEKILNDFLKKGFKFVSLDELVAVMRGKKRYHKILSVTFDDGFRDNIEIGYPILKSLNVPAIINVATGLIDGSCIPWWNVLEEMVLSKEVVYTFNNNPIPSKTKNEKIKAFLTISKDIRMLPYSKRGEMLSEYFSFVSGRGSFQKEMISSEQLRLFSNDSLLSFGAHTHNHVDCLKISTEDFRTEIQKNLFFLRKYGISPKHFAFPFGVNEYSEEYFKILNEANFDSVLTKNAFWDASFFNDTLNLFSIPRVTVSELDDFSICGCYDYLKHRLLHGNLGILK